VALQRVEQRLAGAPAQQQRWPIAPAAGRLDAWDWQAALERRAHSGDLTSADFGLLGAEHAQSVELPAVRYPPDRGVGPAGYRRRLGRARKAQRCQNGVWIEIVLFGHALLLRRLQIGIRDA
jgi:hypothetical protein